MEKLRNKVFEECQVLLNRWTGLKWQWVAGLCLSIFYTEKSVRLFVIQEFSIMSKVFWLVICTENVSVLEAFWCISPDIDHWVWEEVGSWKSRASLPTVKATLISAKAPFVICWKQDLSEISNLVFNSRLWFLTKMASFTSCSHYHHALAKLWLHCPQRSDWWLWVTDALQTEGCWSFPCSVGKAFYLNVCLVSALNNSLSCGGWNRPHINCYYEKARN